jgi:hypothetical protein
MSPADLLAEAAAAGLTVMADGDRLVVRGDRRAEDLAHILLRRKAEILGVLRAAPGKVVAPCPAPPAHPATPKNLQQSSTPPTPWDQAEADRLLAVLLRQLARIERKQYRGQFPAVVARVVADGVAVCEGHIRDHEKLAAQGWDPLEYLHGQVQLTLALARGEPQGRCPDYRPGASRPRHPSSVPEEREAFP